MPDNLNLTLERGPNVWRRRRAVSPWKSELGGAVLLAAGTAAAVAGGRMLYCAVREARRRTSAREWTPDLVGRESMESFPASDSPSWTSEGAQAFDGTRGSVVSSE